jgi:hypothetical protein
MLEEADVFHDAAIHGVSFPPAAGISRPEIGPPLTMPLLEMDDSYGVRELVTDRHGPAVLRV